MYLPYYWGVDSALKVTKPLYHCVLQNFGKPSFWGRYLAPIEGKVEGLTKDEIELLHHSGTKLLPIYSKFQEAVGYRQGKVIAQNTIQKEKYCLLILKKLFPSMKHLFVVLLMEFILAVINQVFITILSMVHLVKPIVKL